MPAFDRWAVPLLILGGVVLAGDRWLAAHPEHNPWAPLNLDDPMGWATERKIAVLRDDADECLAVLHRSNVGFTRLDPAGEDACARRDRTVLSAIPLRPDTPPTTCAVAAGLSLSHRAMAQKAADRPSATPIALRQLDRDTLIPQSMARDLGPLIAAPPQVIVTPRWRVTVAFAPTVPLFASTARFAEAISGCLSELPASTEPSAFAASNSPWATFDSAAAAVPLVLISISPNAGPGV